MSLLLLLAATAEARVDASLLRRPLNCWWGCADALRTVTFSEYGNVTSYWGKRVRSNNYLTTLAYCMDRYCTESEQALGYEEFHGYATEYGEPEGPIPSYEELLGIVKGTPEEVYTIGNTNMYNTTILPDKASWTVGFNTEYIFEHEMTLHHAFGWAMFIYAGLIAAIGLGNRLYAAARWRLAASDVEGKGYSPSALSRVYTSYRKHLGVPAIGKNHNELWGWVSVPTRLQSLLIFIYVVMNFVFLFPGYTLFDLNLFWPNHKDEQLARYLADRTGIMSFYNLVLVWVLAGRNDVFLWVTGWSFSSANLFHKWTASITLLHAVIHSFAWTWIEREAIATEWAELYWRTGVFATITMCLMFPFSVRKVREKAYEVFLLMHIALALPTLVLLFCHVAIFEGSYDGWLWACVAVWCFDRLLRVARILWFWTGTSNATIIDGLLIRLSVTTTRPSAVYPGGYYFLYSPWSLTPWENHPFTVSSWEKNDGITTLHFLVAPCAGWTRRIARGSKSCTILMEGPYGAHHDLSSFDHVLLVAGGSGVTAIAPHVRALANTETDVTVVWAAPDSHYAADILSNELANTFASIYLTREKDHPDPDHLCGRPDVDDIVAKAVANIQGNERLAVLACGPGSMMDDLRAAVVASYGTVQGHQIEYFEEAFTW